jgi:hypothetical protein
LSDQQQCGGAPDRLSSAELATGTPSSAHSCPEGHRASTALLQWLVAQQHRSCWHHQVSTNEIVLLRSLCTVFGSAWPLPWVRCLRVCLALALGALSSGLPGPCLGCAVFGSAWPLPCWVRCLRVCLALALLGALSSGLLGPCLVGCAVFGSAWPCLDRVGHVEAWTARFAGSWLATRCPRHLSVDLAGVELQAWPRKQLKMKWGCHAWC